MKEKLEAKLKELQTGLNQAMANVNAFQGAIQAVLQLQKDQEAENSKPVETTPISSTLITT